MESLKQDIVRLTLSDTPTPDIKLAGLPRFMPGWVWLAGAGPGDVGLLTLHTVNALQQADSIVYDALVSEDILALARADSETFYAGKRGGKPFWKQEDISNKLVALAGEGKRVLRLKGGDPFVFGRGGEEAERLVQENIPFRLIPGVTAGIAAPEYAGIPVTHRDINHAVTFVTGHLAGTDKTELLDWAAISQGSPVIVVYMAMSRLAVIADLLMQAGRAGDEAVAIITHATTARQFVLETTLANAAREAAQAKLEPPSIIIIGAVARLRETLNWFAPALHESDK
ncbi:MAG: uroporphyrinogen-III C-methyltransferase [Alphaproteobacteria bacterium]|nr:uroporphyrinogen-III C-methyltransferase [Alphaproteobacteria bacterium]